MIYEIIPPFVDKSLRYKESPQQMIETCLYNFGYQCNLQSTVPSLPGVSILWVSAFTIREDLPA